MVYAVDNIDFLQDTPFGKNSLHGTVIVISQRDYPESEPVYGPLDIMFLHMNTTLSISTSQTYNQKTLHMIRIPLNEPHCIILSWLIEHGAWQHMLSLSQLIQNHMIWIMFRIT